ncbi:helix-turn-helix transcriptional regulator [Nonomuraea sp. NPDC005730]
MYEQTTIGARLRILRKWRGLTLVELAGLSGVSKSHLSYAERGERTLDRRSHIAASHPRFASQKPNWSAGHISHRTKYSQPPTPTSPTSGQQHC